MLLDQAALGGLIFGKLLTNCIHKIDWPASTTLE